MPEQQLIKYIDQARAAGQSDEQIRNNLLEAGWDNNAIEDVLNPNSEQPNLSNELQQPSSLRGIGDLLKESWQIYKKRFKTFVGISIIFPVVIMLFSLGFPFAASLLKDKNSATILAMIAIWLIIFIVIIFLATWPQVALLYAIKERDAQIGIKDSFAKGWRKIFSFWWISVLTSLIVASGFLLLIIPGIIFSIWFALSAYVLIGEDLKGMKALSRSKQLIKDYWGKVFLRFAVVSIIGLVIYSIFGLIGGIFKISLVEDLIALIVSILLTPFVLTYMYLIYENLKQLKSGEVFENAKKGTSFILLGVLGTFVLIGGILASIVLVSLNPARMKARDAKRKGDIAKVRIVLEEYYLSNEIYPNDLNQLTALEQFNLYFPYGMPTDPKTSNLYEYKLMSGGQDFELCAELEQVIKTQLGLGQEQGRICASAMGLEF
ncbi:MAG: hypothetical protein ABH887_00015 [bacterium]